MQEGFIVQILGEIKLVSPDNQQSPVPVVFAHIVRDFSGVDPKDYHLAYQLQAPFCPLNIKRSDRPTQSDDSFYSLEADQSVGETEKSQQDDADQSKDLFEVRNDKVCFILTVIKLFFCKSFS